MSLTAKNGLCNLHGCNLHSKYLEYLFVHDHNAWQDAFFNAWEKMGINGYGKEMLTEGPTNGQLLAPFMP